MSGSGPDGRWADNGKPTTWEDWQIEVALEPGGAGLHYSMRHKPTNIELNVICRLEANEVVMVLTPAAESLSLLEQVEWIDLPLLACEHDEFTFARTELHQRSWRPLPGGGHGLFERKRVMERISDTVADGCPVRTMHACVFNGAMCCAVHTNFPVSPLVSELMPSGRHAERAGVFRIGIGTYRYRVRGARMEPLRFSVVFLTDLNGDGCADECDYQLWMNRRLPDANPIYKEAIWYKVFCADPKRGVLTTYRETLEIIRRIHRITSGIPQIVYLVGWQFNGHDTGYPALNRLHPGLAEHPDRAREELLELVRRAREEYDCIVSFHINVDDAYRSSPDWNPAILSRNPDGSPRVWLDPGPSDSLTKEGRAYHISHTKDVESGDVFRRLDAFLELVPVSETVHLDAFRNTNASWDGDGCIGPLEELVCGMKPIIAYFKERGIDVSTEGQNGMPIEDAGLFSAYWHYTPTQLYHGKIVGGGSFYLDAVTWGKGASIDTDIAYRGGPSGEPGSSDEFASQWNRILDILYLGSMLYRFYLQREMVEMRENDDTVTIRFSDGVIVRIDKRGQRLSVTKGSLVIASGHDRFIPLGDRIYLYSRDGSDREWPLPGDWTTAGGFNVLRLTVQGIVPENHYTVEDGTIRIKLEPRVPILLERKPDDAIEPA